MSDISPPSALPGIALAALETDLALALRAPNVAVDRELLSAYVEAAAPNSIRGPQRCRRNISVLSFHVE